jgi:hypothetical protein
VLYLLQECSLCRERLQKAIGSVGTKQKPVDSSEAPHRIVLVNATIDAW